MGVMSFSVPLISGSFVVIGRRPEPPPAAIVDRLRAAYIPFTGYTWLLVGGLLVTSAIVMMTFEYGVKEAIGGAFCESIPRRGLHRRPLPPLPHRCDGSSAISLLQRDGTTRSPMATTPSASSALRWSR